MRLPKIRPLIQKLRPPRPPRGLVAGVLQVAGIAGIATGVGLVAEWAGVLVGGFGLLVLGIAVELGGRPPRPPRAPAAPTV